MSGGAWEEVAAYITDGSKYLLSGGELVATSEADPEGYRTRSTKYATAYPYDSSNDTNVSNYNFYKSLKNANYGYGDAILETSSYSGNEQTGWFGDYTVFFASGGPFLSRGGHSGLGTASGIFAYAWNASQSNGSQGFRIVLCGS